MKKALLAILFIVVVVGILQLYRSGTFSQLTVRTAPPSPTTETSPLPTADQIRATMATGAQQREEGKFAESEKNLVTAFEQAITINDPTLAVEAGNNLSITYRLMAGRARREQKMLEAQKFSQDSLDVYQVLQDNGWFNEQDPGLARNWAHALLYSGKIKEAIPALTTSRSLQTAPAAQGDEACHLAAAYIGQGQFQQALPLITQGTKQITENNGSKVWELFCVMTHATYLSQTGKGEEAQKMLTAGLQVAKEQLLKVREEEIQHMLNQPADKKHVLQTVGTL